MARDDEPIRKVIRRRIRVNRGGVQAVGDVNAVVAANVSRGNSSAVSVSSRQRIVQRSRSTAEARSDSEEEDQKTETDDRRDR